MHLLMITPAMFFSPTFLLQNDNDIASPSDSGPIQILYKYKERNAAGAAAYIHPAPAFYLSSSSSYY
jgi:hypothetical protein